MWPNESDYTKALMRAKPFPFTLLSRNKMVVLTNENGDPIKKAGSNSVVFKVSIDGKMLALKCYTSEIYDQANYLTAVQKYIAAVNTHWLVPFKLFNEEELVIVNEETSYHGTYCFLLMPWVDGLTLYDYAKKCCEQRNINALQGIFNKFQQMAHWLLAQPFAHGDLSPENILVTPDGNLKLIDHNKILFNELQITKGHAPLNKDYQHPKRNYNVVDLTADDFSVLVLTISLRALQIKPELFFANDNRSSFLFNTTSIREGENSSIYKELNNIPDPYLQNLLKLLSLSLRRQTVNVPMLSTCLMDNTKDIPASRDLEIHLEELKNELENSTAQIHFLKSEAFAERVAKEKQIAENKRLTEEITTLKRKKKQTKRAVGGLAVIGIGLLAFGITYMAMTNESNPVAKNKMTVIQAKQSEPKNKVKSFTHDDSLLASIQAQTISVPKAVEDEAIKTDKQAEATVMAKPNMISTVKENTPIIALEESPMPEKNFTPTHFTRQAKKKVDGKVNNDVSFRTGNF